VFAWHDAERFDCSICEDKPSLKPKLGCDGPPEVEPWRFPPNNPREPGEPGGPFLVNCCPLKFLTPDVLDLYRSLSLAGGNLSISEQRSLPGPYLQAWALARGERDAAQAERAKAKK